MRNLVLLRCGKSSLHHDWLGHRWNERQFDLVLSYFDAEAFAAHIPQEGVRALLILGGKWDGIARSIEACPDILAADYVWLPDDDLATDVGSINDMFRIAQTYALSVCQPALTRDSYYSHLHVLQCDGFQLRYTNSIEVMAPCLDRATLTACLPLMAESRSGFGLDWIWTRLADTNPEGGAILDSIAIRHTRPIGSSLAKTMSDTEREREDMALLHRAGVAMKPYNLCHAAILTDGRISHSQTRIGFAIWRNVQKHLAEYLDPVMTKREAIKSLRRHLLRRDRRDMITLPPKPLS